MTTGVAANLARLQERIAAATQRVGRATDSVRLVAVSKKVDIASIREAYGAGQRHFGENYIQEALGKIEALRDLDIEWHAIGAVQSNKLKEVARHFGWFHGLSTRSQIDQLVKITHLTNPPQLAMHVFLQLNLADEPTKAGLRQHEVEPFVYHLEELKVFQVSGLMTIPPVTEDEKTLRGHFAAVRNLAGDINRLKLHHTQIHHLSMGMSADFEIAIEEGATIVRVGEALFGPRKIG